MSDATVARTLRDPSSPWTGRADEPRDAYVPTAPPTPAFQSSPMPADESLRLTAEDEARPATHVGRVARIGLAVLGAFMVVGVPHPALAQAIDQLAPSVTVAVEDEKLRSARTRHEYAAAVKNPTVRVDSLPLNPNRYQVNRAIEQVAARYDVPADILKAIAWQESSWIQMRDGRVVANENRDKSTGVLVSTDWGILQINDRAHPRAFPRARTDVRFNLEFAASLLHSLYDENGSDWDRAVARYNGVNNPEYLEKIHHAMQVQPWTYGVARDELHLRQDERRTVETQRTAAAREVKWRDQLVTIQQKRVDAFGPGINPVALPASQRKAYGLAEHNLGLRQQRAQTAHARLDALTAREGELDGQIASLTETMRTEAQRLNQIEKQEAAEQRAAARAHAHSGSRHGAVGSTHAPHHRAAASSRAGGRHASAPASPTATVAPHAAGHDAPAQP